MKVIMNYLVAEQKKHLLWCVFDDEEAELNRYRIFEFRVCDCFVDWIIHFRNKKNKDSVFSEEDITNIFDEIPTEKAECDIFFLFGKVTIVCCRNAVMTSWSSSSTYTEKKLTIRHHCLSCELCFVKNVSTRFIRIK